MSEVRIPSRRSRPAGRRPAWSRWVAGATGAALAAMGLAVAAEAPVGAATNTVSGATFEWSISDETNAASFNGQCNYWSAGQSDSTSATYAATNGNATVLKLDATDTYVPISDYANRCKDKLGAAVNFLNPPAAVKRLGQKVRFTGGTGTVDPATGASSIQWTGTFTVNFYGTAVPFWIKNPHLTVDAAGNGSVTAAMGGFASSQADPDVRVPLPDATDVVIATLAGVAGANTTGFTTTPVYTGVTYDVDPESGQSPQSTGPAAGSWPEAFVDFQMTTGLGSYWYSSGSSIDVRKPPTPLTVAYGALTPVRSTTATPNGNLNPIVANAIAVSGSGFTGFQPSEQGIYTGLVKASEWQPGQVPDIADFSGATYTPKAALAGGTLSTTVTVPANTVTDPDATYGIATICAHGCSLTNRSFDTFTPVDFVDRRTTVSPGVVDQGVANAISVTGAAFAGFASSPPPGEAGVYTGLVKASEWQPGQVPDIADFVGATFTPKQVISGGAFTTTVNVPANTVTDPNATYGIATICAHGCSLTNRSYDTFTPVDFVSISGDPTHAVAGSGYGTYVPPVPGGVAPTTWSLKSGSLPPGVVLNTANGLVAGTPTTEGRYTAVVTAADSKVPTPKKVSKTLTIAVGPQDFHITTEALPGVALRVPYSQQIVATGGVEPYSFKVLEGTRPAGIAVSTSGIVKGTTKAEGDFPITIQVKDKFGYTAVKAYTLHVAPASVTLSITPTTLPASAKGVAYSQALTASGGTSGPYTFSKSAGALPAGLSLKPTGLVAGTPTMLGSYLFSVVAKDKYGYVSAPQGYLFEVGPANVTVSITPTTLPASAKGVAYSQALTASGGITGPYTFSKSAGALPAGLSLKSTGLLSGTPTTLGLYLFSVVATDKYGYVSAPQGYLFEVGPANVTVSITPTTLPAGAKGVAYSQALAASGGITGPYTFSRSAGAPPPGVSLKSTGLVSGTPTTPGTYLFSVVAKDKYGYLSAPVTYSVTVA